MTSKREKMHKNKGKVLQHSNKCCEAEMVYFAELSRGTELRTNIY